MVDNSISMEDKINSLEPGGIVIFTAHGHDEKLNELASKKGLTILDCICPKVKSNMNQIKEKLESNFNIIFVGIEKHPETTACLSISDNIHLFDVKSGNFNAFSDDKLVFVTNQTTLNFKELEYIFNKIKNIYPNAVFNNEICPATRLRQENILKIEDDVDVVFVVGDKNSSNTKRLFEISSSGNKKASTYLISSESDLIANMLQGKKHAVITSGTSTPLEVINSIYKTIENLTK